SVCMFYGEKYTKENVAKLIKYLDAMNVDNCYLDDATEPYLVWQTRIDMNPFRYHRYNDEIVTMTTNNETHSAVDVSLTINAQVVEFMNLVFLAYDPINEEIYNHQCVTQKEILSIVWKYTNIFDEKSVMSFTKWCS
ncbi:hypothetical protein DM01DRAFT_1273387, partial [Hesseltinella vesiculosa]